MKKQIFLLPLSLGVGALMLQSLFLVSVASKNKSTPIEQTPQPPRFGEQKMVETILRRDPLLDLADGRDLLTTYDGSAEKQHALELNSARPTTLAAADFDEDGIPDLVCGYEDRKGGFFALHRGNVDAIYANSVAAQQRRANGSFTNSPFLAPASIFELPASPYFLLTGDFDADGHVDVAAAAYASESLYLLSGFGTGSFAPPKQLDLPGKITALGSGESNRADGLSDLAIAVAGAAGAKLLMFEGPQGALRSDPEEFPLPATATGLLITELNQDTFGDVAVTAGRELLVVEGRDRGLVVSKAASRARVSHTKLPFSVISITAGDFDGGHPQELAVLADDGALHVFSRSASKSRDDVDQQIEWKDNKLVAGAWSSAARLITAKVSMSTTDDLLIADKANERVNVVTCEGYSSGTLRGHITEAMNAKEGWAAALPMRLNADARGDLVILRSNQVTPAIVTAPQSTFTVINTLDSGTGSLRDAINLANTNPGADIIDFNISPGGPQTISLSTGLPVITGPVTIDGTTQPGFSGSPIIELNGSGTPPGTNGLLITAGTSTIRGLVINRFPGSGDGIELQSIGGNIVEGNFIGTDVAGNVAQPNGNGVFINGPPNNTIGGTTSAARNVISGNNGTGIRIFFLSATGNVIQGNFIGTNALGTADLGNATDGLAISQAVTTVGGTVAGARNIISGNNNNGILLSGSSGNLVQGNFIGTDVNGTAAVGNSQSGSQVTGASANNTFGGTTTAARNIISGNLGNGLQIRQTGTDGNQVLGNFIGTQVNGTSAAGNGGVGVLVENLASNNSIGATASGAGNVIAFNSDDGVTLFGGTGNAVRSNSIFSNAGLGIDLDANGVTLNDNCDGDSGGNNLQNFPVILGSGHTGSTITIQGTLNSTANSTFSLDFFLNNTCDSFGFGEGAIYIGTSTVTTDDSCLANFFVTFTAAVSTGQVVTATATDPTGNTSEFSLCSFPTAAPATISGKISAVDGMPLSGVLVTLTGGNQLRRAITSAEGNYSFVGVDTGNFYSVAPQLANYLFSPPERSFSLLGNKSDAVFTGTPTQQIANPLDTPEFFVRQNYLDFLGREPDQGGFDYWSQQLRACNGDDRCLSSRRIDVSAAFFVEREFQRSGSFIYRIYKGSLGRHPNFNEFSHDRALVPGGATFEEAQQAFADQWIQRAIFRQLYPESITVTEFVNRLFDTAALRPYEEERREQIEAMGSGKTRAQVLRDVIEIGGFKTGEYNPSFVLMEYFGYLQREPDSEGYAFWLDVLNNREPGNYRSMVCAFVTSREYQQRFSAVVTRSNSECGR
jgi:hypothetical protein